MTNDLDYRWVAPDEALADFVESFWRLGNQANSDKEIIVLPDGRIDLIFSPSATGPVQATLLGVGTRPDQAVLTAKTQMFVISFKLLATEYIFHDSVSGLLNSAKNLPAGFWDFTAADLADFDLFCQKSTQRIRALLPQEIDGRKRKLFDLLYASNGCCAVRELAEQVGWSSRQINRYFNQQYGLSLKKYSSILRFRASFQHLKAGKLFPQQSFADQSHFIREIKKLSGVLPKDLSRNQNDRFIQFSTLL
ncbi:helix-turn-helix domain-containing protein [Hymenobacter psoromatis]|uniref:helix-turn-helix domain-containing protein n=1 Tax=Hymenobacter psoromatis TaxID=1484116 RepID=UPI001CBFABB3|nr:AraC family transcriptional regulator [Hymenobacter psoromatis]